MEEALLPLGNPRLGPQGPADIRAGYQLIPVIQEGLLSARVPAQKK